MRTSKFALMSLAIAISSAVPLTAHAATAPTAETMVKEMQLPANPHNADAIRMAADVVQAIYSKGTVKGPTPYEIEISVYQKPSAWGRLVNLFRKPTPAFAATLATTEGQKVLATQTEQRAYVSGVQTTKAQEGADSETKFKTDVLTEGVTLSVTPTKSVDGTILAQLTYAESKLNSMSTMEVSEFKLELPNMQTSSHDLNVALHSGEPAHLDLGDYVMDVTARDLSK